MWFEFVQNTASNHSSIWMNRKNFFFSLAWHYCGSKHSDVGRILWTNPNRAQHFFPFLVICEAAICCALNEKCDEKSHRGSTINGQKFPWDQTRQDHQRDWRETVVWSQFTIKQMHCDLRKLLYDFLSQLLLNAHDIILLLQDDQSRLVQQQLIRILL